MLLSKKKCRGVRGVKWAKRWGKWRENCEEKGKEI